MIIDMWSSVQTVMIGFIGGLTGTCLGLQGARQFLLKYYLKYRRIKDYDRLHNTVVELLSENKILKNTLKSVQKDLKKIHIVNKGD